MIIHHNIAHLQHPLFKERDRAHNSGRHRDAQVCLEMLHRLEAVGKLDKADPTFVLVTAQAKNLLHEIWEKRPVTLDPKSQSADALSEDE